MNDPLPCHVPASAKHSCSAPHRLRACFLRGAALLVSISGLSNGSPARAQAPAELTAGAVWIEDFSNIANYRKDWSPYGRLADGTWAQGFESTQGGTPARAEWWIVEGGALYGRNFPEEKHAAGISRIKALPATLEQSGMVVSWRVMLHDGAKATLRIFGISSGVLALEKTDNHVTALEVSTSGLRLWNGNRLLQPPVSQSGAPASGTAQGEGEPKAERRFKNSVFETKSPREIPPGGWVALKMELRGRTVRVLFDGLEVLTHTLESEQPLRTLSLEVEGDKKSTGVAAFDDIIVAPASRER